MVGKGVALKKSGGASRLRVSLDLTANSGADAAGNEARGFVKLGGFVIVHVLSLLHILGIMGIR